MRYDYKCDACGAEMEREFPMKLVKSKVKCSCGKMARRDFKAPGFRVSRRYMEKAREHRGRGY